MAKLPPAEQSRLVAAFPGVFVPASGAWGRAGSTLIELRAANARTVHAALTAASARAAQKRAPSPRSARKRSAKSGAGK